MHGLEADIMEEHVGDDNWGELNRTDWRGLGLTDPIKKVEASDSKILLSALRLEDLGQMVVTPSFFKSQRPGQTTY